jgi:hypothetical protein
MLDPKVARVLSSRQHVVVVKPPLPILPKSIEEKRNWNMPTRLITPLSTF